MGDSNRRALFLLRGSRDIRKAFPSVHVMASRDRSYYLGYIRERKTTEQANDIFTHPEL